MKKIIHSPFMVITEGIFVLLLLLVLFTTFLRSNYVNSPEETIKNFILNNHLITMDELSILPQEGMQLFVLQQDLPETLSLPVDAALINPEKLNSGTLLKDVKNSNRNTIFYSDDPALAVKAAIFFYQMGAQKIFVLIPKDYEKFAGENLQYSFVKDSTATVEYE